MLVIFAGSSLGRRRRVLGVQSPHDGRETSQRRRALAGSPHDARFGRRRPRRRRSPQRRAHRLRGEAVDGGRYVFGESALRERRRVGFGTPSSGRWVDEVVEARVDGSDDRLESVGRRSREVVAQCEDRAATRRRGRDEPLGELLLLRVRGERLDRAFGRREPRRDRRLDLRLVPHRPRDGLDQRRRDGLVPRRRLRRVGVVVLRVGGDAVVASLASFGAKASLHQGALGRDRRDGAFVGGEHGLGLSRGLRPRQGVGAPFGEGALERGPQRRRRRLARSILDGARALGVEPRDAALGRHVTVFLG
mmetsp:Transcript_7177/g.29828  ORF Transcript_7177/g.29828 Transcript_7177/m.29828 type:complete len:306 (+) Transcript_7177:1011-1928(+)